MICPKCGNASPDGSAFCQSCGAKLDAAPQPQPQNSYATPTPTSARPPKAKPDKKKLAIIAGIIAGGIAVLALLIWLISFLVGNTPENVAKDYVKALRSGDVKKADSYVLLNSSKFNNKAIEMIAEGNDISTKEVFENVTEYFKENDVDITVKNMSGLYKGLSKAMKDELKEDYGLLRIITTSIEDKKDDVEKIDDEDLEDYIESWASYAVEGYNYYVDEDDEIEIDDFIDTDKIKEGYRVTVSYSVKGLEDDDDGTLTLTLVKYKGRWKVLSTSYALQLIDAAN